MSKEIRVLFEIAEVAGMCMTDLIVRQQQAHEDMHNGLISPTDYQAITSRKDTLQLLLSAAGFTERDKYTGFLVKPDNRRCQKTDDMFEATKQS